MSSVSVLECEEFVYERNIPSKIVSQKSNEKTKKVSNTNELQTKSERRQELIYRNRVKEDVYDRIVSEEMDLPDSDFEKIKHLPKGTMKVLDKRRFMVRNARSGGEKIVLTKNDHAVVDEISDKIGSVDLTGIRSWLATTNGQEFLNGNYKDLSDYLNKKIEEDRALGKKGLDEKNRIISEEMDLPDSDFYRISKVPKNIIKKVLSKDAPDWITSRSLLSKEYGRDIAGIGTVDIGDLKSWLGTANGKEFLNGDYEDLSDYLKKRVESGNE